MMTVPDTGMDGTTSAYDASLAMPSEAALETPPKLEDLTLVPAYQPIVAATDTRSVHGYEALIRGRLGDGRLVGAGTIMAAARRAGQIVAVDARARQAAIQWASLLPSQAQLYLNFSPRSAGSATGCPCHVLAPAWESGLASKRIVFELTETENYDDFDKLCASCRCYRDMGCGLAIDDLGSGYAALVLMDALAPDTVKIDKALTQRVASDERKAIVVSHLLGMARDLGIATIAEGIENAADLAWLAEHGATYAQGFHIGLPWPADLWSGADQPRPGRWSSLGSAQSQSA